MTLEEKKDKRRAIQRKSDLKRRADPEYMERRRERAREHYANLTLDQKIRLHAGRSEYLQKYSKQPDAKRKANERAEKHRKTPEAQQWHRNWQLKRLYNMTPQQWEAVFEKQGRCCAICKASESGSKRNWHTDHSHETGSARGILCHQCNLLLGAAKDRIPVLELAADYLKKSLSRIYPST
jgi:hypothetical protein